MWKLPQHLQKYIVDQDYDRYTPIDHSVWRYVLRQLRNYLSQHAHEFYLEGLKKTGIEVESIPRISQISEKLEKFGWRALPVSGFIPPAAFMELQALGVLPIASDMRIISHLMYTPAPDIVHEAAGHAPMLAHPEFANYLRQYATVARRAIISREDLAVYSAIRTLSDLKESSSSTAEQIRSAQEHLDQVSKNVSHVSEATLLSRMNWWTAEYGLIGTLDKPKIFGAGLLSSVGESKFCLSSKVTKLPLTVDCVHQSYDITEPQPQLFVTPSFEALGQVLAEFAKTMAYQRGGMYGAELAIKAETVNTIELNSGLQISGQFTQALGAGTSVTFVKAQGPCQLCVAEQELPAQGKKQHPEGFSTPIGFWQTYPDRCPSLLGENELRSLGLVIGQTATLNFASGFQVSGKVKNLVRDNGKLVIVTWDDCTMTYKGDKYYDPTWGTFDMAVGSVVTSVFGGPADRQNYGATEDFAAAKVPAKVFSDRDKHLHQQYRELRKIREGFLAAADIVQTLSLLMETHEQDFPEDWLFWLECFELCERKRLPVEMQTTLRLILENLIKKSPENRSVIEDGLALASVP